MSLNLVNLDRFLLHTFVQCFSIASNQYLVYLDGKSLWSGLVCVASIRVGPILINKDALKTNGKHG